MQIINILILAQLLFSCGTTGKTGDDKCKTEVDTLTSKIVYTYVNERPEYPGGNSAIIKFFAENYKYPKQEQFQATFQLEFIVNEHGKIVAPRIKGKRQEQLTEAEKEAIRILEIMHDWEPGKCNNKKVPVKVFFPLKF